MAAREPIDLPALFVETPDTVRERMLRRLPPAWSREEGSVPRDLLEMCVYESSLLWSELNRVLLQSFPSTATGAYMDAHGESYGVQRGTGTLAVGVMRFSGSVGAAVPPATLVQVPTTDPEAQQLRFQTTNTSSAAVGASGYVDVPVQALLVGADHNVAAGAITLLGNAVPNITGVTNPAAMTQGSDPQDDDALRGDVLDQAALPSGGGSQLDYIVWAKQVAGVEDVAVAPLWDKTGVTPGTGNPNLTVGLTLRDAARAPVDWAVLQAAQRYLDPSRQLVAIMEDGETWSPITGPAPTWDPTDPQVGDSVLRLSVSGGPQVNVVELVRPMDLSRFDADDEFYLWLRATDWARVNNASYLRFHTDAANYYSIPFGPAAPAPGVVKPASGSAWFLLRARKGTFTATGAPNWSSIASVRIGYDFPGVAGGTFWSLDADYFSIRSLQGAAGEGRATIGHAVTVFTPVPKSISVSATVTLAPGYTLTGAPGSTNIVDLVKANLTAFLRTLAPGSPVRVADIANAIHDTPGVVDFELTNPAANVPVALNQYAVLGGVSLF